MLCQFEVRLYAAYRLQRLERQKEWDEWDKWEEWGEWGALENGIAAKRHKMHPPTLKRLWRDESADAETASACAGAATARRDGATVSAVPSGRMGFYWTFPDTSCLANFLCSFGAMGSTPAVADAMARQGSLTLPRREWLFGGRSAG
jgi:hypothetical protein